MTTNKKGILRIIEAGIAIMIIFGVMLVIYQNRQTQITQQDLSKMIPSLLEEISLNNTLREKIVNNDSTAVSEVQSFLATRITQPNLGYAVRICEPQDICGLDNYPTQINGNIYTSEWIISSTLTTYAPKKVKIFLWRTK